MIQFLASFFIRDSRNYKSPEVRQAYGVLSGAVGIGLNIFLFFGKWIAGMLSGSIAITADAFNNLSDAGSSFISLVGFKFSGMKADADHPFGHGRIEYVSGFGVSMVIILMGVELFKTSIEKIFHPEPVETGALAVGILVVSICVKGYMCFYNRAVGKKIQSETMKATAMDSMSDSIATTAVLISMAVAHVTGISIDGWCGCLVACFVLYAGFSAAKDTLNPLLGEPPSREFVNEIRTIVMAHPEILGIHDLVVHDYGPGRRMISLHGEVSGDCDIFEIHDVIDRIEKELKEKLGCEAVIHMDPIVVEDEQVNRLRLQLSEIARSIDPRFTIHDFRMVEGPTHTNLIFDLVIPHNCKMKKSDIYQRVNGLVNELGPQYYTVITIENSFVTETGLES